MKTEYRLSSTFILEPLVALREFYDELSSTDSHIKEFLRTAIEEIEEVFRPKIPEVVFINSLYVTIENALEELQDLNIDGGKDVAGKLDKAINALFMAALLTKQSVMFDSEFRALLEKAIETTGEREASEEGI